MSTVVYTFTAYSSTLSVKSNHDTTIKKELDMARNVMVADTKMYKLHILLLGFKNYTQWGMLQGTMLQRTVLSIKSGCYNERRYSERMLQRRVFINKIRMLQRTMLQ